VIPVNRRVFAARQGLYSRDSCNYELDKEDIKFKLQLSDVSHQIQDVGAKLELSYPSLYVDLSRQLNMPLRSQVSAPRMRYVSNLTL